MAELLARLRAALRRAGPVAGPRLMVGDVTIDLARHVVTKAGEEIHLTPTEYALLRVDDPARPSLILTEPGVGYRLRHD